MTPQHFLFTVAAEDSGTRLDKYLVAHLPALSRSQLQRLIQEGQVGLTQGVVTASYRVREGDIITLHVPPPRPARPVAEALALPIVYEDNALLVIDKPPGLVVHPSPGHTSGTLVNALLFHCQTLSGIGGEERPGIVHRLDKDTSGAIVVAKDDATHRGLARQFAERQVKKRYLAIVRGNLRVAEGVIDAAVGRHPIFRQKMSTHTRAGRPAVTAFRVLERFAAYTLVELHPRTGRTHQIRVHMAAMGHPLLGDATYGRRRQAAQGSPLAQRLAWFRRQALHAWVLGFRHPATQEWHECCAPLPPDLEQLLTTLRADVYVADVDTA